MNKKQLAVILLGNVIGGLGAGYGFIHWSLKNRQAIEGSAWWKEESLDNSEFNDWVTALGVCTTFVGSIFGTIIGGFCSLLSICQDEETRLEIRDDPAYREFYASQNQIQTNSNQLVSSESTPLLQEHIVNINNEENLPSINTSSTHNYNSL